MLSVQSLLQPLPASDAAKLRLPDSAVFDELLLGLAAGDKPADLQPALVPDAGLVAGMVPLTDAPELPVVPPEGVLAMIRRTGEAGKDLPFSGKSLPPALPGPASAAGLPSVAAPAEPVAQPLIDGRQASADGDPDPAATVAASVRGGVAGLVADSFGELQLMAPDRTAGAGVTEPARQLSPAGMIAGASDSALPATMLRLMQSQPGRSAEVGARTPGFIDGNPGRPADSALSAASADTLLSLAGTQRTPDAPVFGLPGSAGSGTPFTLSTTAGTGMALPVPSESGQNVRDWSAALGQRMLLLAGNGVESARLQLSPASLGSLDIQIRLEDDRAHVSFGVQHAATRDALEAAMPRLRELFAAQGMELVQADVQDQDTAGQKQSRAALAPRSLLAGSAGLIESSQSASRWAARQSEHSLDIYV